jgi:hypothetical protein
MKIEKIQNNNSQFIVYITENGNTKIDVRFENETVWFTQKSIASLFDVSVPTINEHLKNIFNSNKLSENSVIRKFRTTASDGKNYNTQFYNSDAVISVGYRANSVRATQFRQ